MKRYFNILFMAAVCLTAICTTSCQQINPLTPDEQFQQQIIGRWKFLSYTEERYKDGLLIGSETGGFGEVSVVVYDADGTYASYIARECDDPSTIENVDQVRIQLGDYFIRDSVLTHVLGVSNIYGNHYVGEVSVCTILSISKTMMCLGETFTKDGIEYRTITDVKRIE